MVMTECGFISRHNKDGETTIKGNRSEQTVAATFAFNEGP